MIDWEEKYQKLVFLAINKFFTVITKIFKNKIDYVYDKMMYKSQEKKDFDIFSNISIIS